MKNTKHEQHNKPTWFWCCSTQRASCWRLSVTTSIYEHVFPTQAERASPDCNVFILIHSQKLETMKMTHKKRKQTERKTSLQHELKTIVTVCTIAKSLWKGWYIKRFIHLSFSYMLLVWKSNTQVQGWNQKGFYIHRESLPAPRPQDVYARVRLVFIKKNCLSFLFRSTLIFGKSGSTC